MADKRKDRASSDATAPAKASPEPTTPPKVSKAVSSIAALVAGMGARKLVTVGWKRITGKEPPSDPQDLHVGIGEALSWVIVLGVTMEAARLLAQRAAVRRMRRTS